jgi:hypothetical protein
MSKYLLIAAAMVVLAVACNKADEPKTETTVEQAAPAYPADAADAPEAAPAEATDEAAAE